MARIRSIHPDILIDPDFAGIPRDARLLFIYTLIVADDAGNLEDSPRALKMACFPGDDDLTVARIEELRDILLAGRFYESYEVDGKRYLHIRNFLKYQRPDHPTKPKCHLFPGQVFTYHVRQGNAFVPKTEQGPPLEPKANVPRTLPERKANVLAGEVRSGLGLGKKRSGLDLDRRGPGGKGKRATASAGASKPPLAAPLQQGADRGNGTHEASWKGNGVKESALNEVARLVSTREIDLAGASEKLRLFNFTPSEINDPALLALLQRAAEGGAT